MRPPSIRPANQIFGTASTVDVCVPPSVKASSVGVDAASRAARAGPFEATGVMRGSAGGFAGRRAMNAVFSEGGKSDRRKKKRKDTDTKYRYEIRIRNKDTKYRYDRCARQPPDGGLKGCSLARRRSVVSPPKRDVFSVETGRIERRSRDGTQPRVITHDSRSLGALHGAHDPHQRPPRRTRALRPGLRDPARSPHV